LSENAGLDTDRWMCRDGQTKQCRM